MTTRLIIFSGTLFLGSCSEDSICVDFQDENKILTQQVDSLKNVIKQSLDPIIINSGSWDLSEGDTARFVVGLMYNDEKIMNSVQMSLLKVNDDNTRKLVSTDLVFPAKNNEKTYGVAHFTLPNLKKGKYLYDGFIVVNDKRVAIQHFFEVYD